MKAMEEKDFFQEADNRRAMERYTAKYSCKKICFRQNRTPLFEYTTNRSGTLV